MSGELNQFDNMQNNDYYGLAGEIDTSLFDNLDNFDFGQSGWPATNDFMDATFPSPQMLNNSPMKAQSPFFDEDFDTGDESLTTSFLDACAMPMKVPPMQAGSAQPASQQAARKSSLDAMFNDLPSPCGESLWQGDNTVEQYQSPNQRRNSLTPGLTATPSPRMRTVEPVRLMLNQGNPAHTGEKMTDVPQLSNSNTLFALPNSQQVTPSVSLGNVDFSFDYNDPEVQRILNDPNYEPELPGMNTAASWNVTPQALNVQPVVPFAAMQGFAAPVAPMTQPNNPVLDAIMADPVLPRIIPEAPPKRLQPLNQHAFNFPTPVAHSMPPQQLPPPPAVKLSQPGIHTRRDTTRKVTKLAPAPQGKRRKTQPIPANFDREAAKLSRKKAWVRVNERAGANNRGGKLNQYDPADHYTPAPAPPTWSAAGHDFEYDEHGELLEMTYTAEQLDAYLRHHKQVTGRDLRVWIQKAPADCGRRSAQKESAECRFAECPLRKLGKRGTIWQGHLRVAFDENYEVYNKSKTSDPVDPFQLAACAHLYCFERFLDVPDLAQCVTIKLDSRTIDTEPNGQFPCRLDPDDKEDRRHFAAIEYMAATKRGVLTRFPDTYPEHSFYPDGMAKPHELTLNGVMNKLYMDELPPPKRRAWIKRDSQSSIFYTLGDLEKYCAAKWPELWAAHTQGRSLQGVKEVPKYERGTRGYTVSRSDRQRHEKKMKQKEAEKLKKRKRYESESESEEDTDNSESESELELHDYSSSEDERREKKREAKRQKHNARDDSSEADSEVEGKSKASKANKSKGKANQRSDLGSDEASEKGLFVPERPRRSPRKARGKQVQYNEDSEMDCS